MVLNLVSIPGRVLCSAGYIVRYRPGGLLKRIELGSPIRFDKHGRLDMAASSVVIFKNEDHLTKGEIRVAFCVCGRAVPYESVLLH